MAYTPYDNRIQPNTLQPRQPLPMPGVVQMGEGSGGMPSVPRGTSSTGLLSQLGQIADRLPKPGAWGNDPNDPLQGWGQTEQYQPFSMQDLLQQDPGYEFTRNQGIEAIRRQNAASGLLGSGGNTRDILDYTTGLASTHAGDIYNRFANERAYRQGERQRLFGNYENADQRQFQNSMQGGNTQWGRLMDMLNAGQNANAGLTGLGGSIGGSMADLFAQGGNAQAAGTVGGANSMLGMLGGVGNLAGQYWGSGYDPWNQPPTGGPQPWDDSWGMYG